MMKNANDMQGLAETVSAETRAIESIVSAAHQAYDAQHPAHRKLAQAIQDAADEEESDDEQPMSRAELREYHRECEQEEKAKDRAFEMRKGER